MSIASSQSAADRWKQAGASSQQRFVDGVNSTQKDPGALAAAQVQKLLTNLTQAITSGRWQRAVTAMGPAAWKQVTVAKAANWGVGIAASVDKYRAAYDAMLPTMQATQSRIDGMPSATLADSIARATEWMTSLHNYKLNKG